MMPRKVCWNAFRTTLPKTIRAAASGKSIRQGAVSRTNFRSFSIYNLFVSWTKPRNGVVVKATPRGYFEEAALDAARSMRFVPGKLKGQAVSYADRLR